MKKVLAILLALIVLTGVVFADEPAAPIGTTTLHLNTTIGSTTIISIVDADGASKTSLGFGPDNLSLGAVLRFVSNSVNGYKVTLSGPALKTAQGEGDATTTIGYTVTPGSGTYEGVESVYGGAYSSDGTEVDFVVYETLTGALRTTNLPFTVALDEDDYADAAEGTYIATLTFNLLTQ